MSLLKVPNKVSCAYDFLAEKLLFSFQQSATYFNFAGIPLLLSVSHNNPEVLQTKCCKFSGKENFPLNEELFLFKIESVTILQSGSIALCYLAISF